jgi:hypothetical protein
VLIKILEEEDFILGHRSLQQNRYFSVDKKVNATVVVNL